MTAPVTFRITTYWKRKRSEPGLTQMGSQRLNIGQALSWICDELPDEAWAVERLDSPQGPLDRVQITIDWSKVPDEIQSGKPA
jgi:hypothetical protein